MICCAQPGCVALVDKADECCPIHRRDVGEDCDRCHGRGTVYRDPHKDGRLVMGVCGECAGTGLKDKRRSQQRGKRQRDPVDQRPVIAAIEEGGR